MIIIYLHRYTIYIYNKVRRDSDDAQGGVSFFRNQPKTGGIGVKTWIGVGRGVGGTPSYINVICFF